MECYESEKHTEFQKKVGPIEFDLTGHRSPLWPYHNTYENHLANLLRSTALFGGLVCLLVAPALSATPVSYGFDALMSGALVGQDGWYADAAQSPTTSTTIATDTGSNATQLMTSGVTNSDRAIRNFGSSFFTGDETKAMFQVDYRVGSDWTSGQVALAGTSDRNQILNGNNTAAFSPRIGLTRNDTGTGIKFSLYPKSGAGWGDAVSQSITFSPGVISVGDWLQVQLVMNFITGTGTLSYKNLTLGQTAFTTLFWNANLGLNGSSSLPNQWNQVWTRIDKPGGSPQLSAIDNLTIVASGPGSEDFQGELGTRYFNVYDYTLSVWDSSTKDWTIPPVMRSLAFPNFVALLANQSAQELQFNERYIPPINLTSDFARIELDPLDPANKCLYLHVFPAPGATGGRNELHYSTPYPDDSQPNGTQYTFAFRFYTPILLPHNLTLMQGYSEFPWLRIVAQNIGSAGTLRLDLAKSTYSTAQYITNGNNAPPDLDTAQGEDVQLRDYKVGSWNTVVVQVTHSNDPATGKIDVFVNGNKMTTYIGRTTFLSDGTKIPWLKAGPYGPEASVYYDDIYWKPGLVYPFSEPGFENNGIYELEPLSSLGKSLNVFAAGTNNGTNVIIADDGAGATHNRWTALAQADGSYEMVPNNATTMRLDVSGAGGSGANVQIWQDNNQPNQRWKSQWQTDGSFELVPQHSTSVRLDVNGGLNTNGANVQVLTDNNSTAQHWRVLRKP